MKTTLSLAALLLAGCAAQAPVAPQPKDEAAADCAAIARSLDRSEAAERSAVNAQSGAWKAIVPMAVAARYANAKKSVEEARRETADLQAQAARLGCPAG